jgi:hypothetical protein
MDSQVKPGNDDIKNQNTIPIALAILNPKGAAVLGFSGCRGRNRNRLLKFIKPSAVMPAHAGIQNDH